MSISYSKLSHGISLTKGMEDAKWLRLLEDHRDWLIRRATMIPLNETIVAQEINRPLVILREHNIPINKQMVVMFINGISLTHGIFSDSKYLYVPTDEDISYLESAYQSEL
jgi:hypothetical protein